MFTSSRCLILAIAIFTSACAGRFEEARLVAPSKAAAAPSDRSRCNQLDDRRVVWSAIAKGSTIAAGTAGLGSIPVDSKDVRIGFAVGGAVFAVVGGVAGLVSDNASESWVKEGCAL